MGRWGPETRWHNEDVGSDVRTWEVYWILKEAVSLPVIDKFLITEPKGGCYMWDRRNPYVTRMGGEVR